MLRKCTALADGTLTKEDFVSVLINISNKQVIGECFEEIDVDHDSQINSEDLSRYLCASLETIEELIIKVFNKKTLNKEDVYSLVTAY